MKTLFRICWLLCYIGAQGLIAQESLIRNSSTTALRTENKTLTKSVDDPILGEGFTDPLTTVPSKSAGNYAAGNTAGILDVSATGALNYTVPIAKPPGVKSIAPGISLSYSGQRSVGLAGYGWDIAGLSSITRGGNTLYHDGMVDPLDLDANDRFFFDGQRLLLKSGTYGKDGSEYYTETHSLIKIRAYGTSPFGAQYGPAYFIVFQPDGTRAWYGNSTGSRSRIEWAIARVQDPQANRMDYSYTNSDNLLRINEINYGGRNGATHPNRIKFNYKTRPRMEQRYIGGGSFARKHLISSIQTFGGSQLYRTYTLSHSTTSLGYSRLVSITEKNKDNQSKAPITFSYDHTNDQIQPYTTDGSSMTIFPGVDFKKHKVSSGDFDGDGTLDMILYNRSAPSEFHLITDLTKGSNVANTYRVPVGRFSDVFGSTILSADGKMIDRDAMTTIVHTGTQTKFRTYALASSVYHQYDKVWNAPTYISKPSCGGSTQRKRIPTVNVAGDFNGDGLTDLIAITKPYTWRSCLIYNNDPGCNPINDDQRIPVPIEGCCECTSETVYSKSAYLIDLNRQKTTDFTSQVGGIGRSIRNGDRLTTADFDGDGKSDLYHFSENRLQILTMDNNNSRLTSLLTLQNDPYIRMNYPILSGDYNGDGKMDMAVPTQNKSSVWRFYISTGTNFRTYNKDIGVWFAENEVTQEGHVFEGEPFPFIIKLFEYHYVAQDYNGDGRTDILSHHVITPYDNSGPNPQSTEKISLHVNRMNSSSTTPYFEGKGYLQRDDEGMTKNGFPVFLDYDQGSANLEYSYVDGNYIHAYRFEKDHRQDVLLRAIDNNGVHTDITYNQDSGKNIYTTGSVLVYPYVSLSKLEGIPLVRKLVQSGSGIERYKEYKYKGAVAHAHGLGFLGFRSILRSQWTGENTEMIWQGTQQDHTLRGAVTQSWTSLSGSHTPNNYISKTTNTYKIKDNDKKVFDRRLIRSVTEDVLKGTSTTTTYSYNSYGSPGTTRIQHADGYKELTNYYSNKLQATDHTYHMGRMNKQVETQVLGSQSFKTTATHTYNQAGLLTKTVKQGNGGGSLTYQYQYDAYGNITRKTLPGIDGNWTESYTYDPSGRYMLSTTDQKGLITRFTYNTTTGTISSITDPYGLTTQMTYDNWQRETRRKDYLNHTTITTYTRQSDGGVYTFVIYPKGADTKTWSNAFGWVTKSGALSRNDSFIYRSVRYDALGRKVAESAPYKGSSPSQWIEWYFDMYGRVTTQSLYTGKDIRTRYEGLQVTVNDGTKTVSTTADTAGNVIQLTDPGGTINYSYHANGVMKKADYGTYSIETTIDAWGRKNSMTDPSAGTYTYQYHDTGLLLKETNPKGSVNLSYDRQGKLITKEITGDHTNIRAQYTYDAKHRNTGISSTVDNSSYTYTYTYDNRNRLQEVTEKVEGDGARAEYAKKSYYDSYGMINRETYTATNNYNGHSNTTDMDYLYDSSGQLASIQGHGGNQLLWQAKSENARRQLETIQLGNGMIQSRNYDSYGLLMQMHDHKVQNGTPFQAMRIAYQFDTQRGVLQQRQNLLMNTNESFEYDNQDRLTKVTYNGKEQVQSYDPRGNITTNPTLGHYTYRPQNPYQLAKVALTDGKDDFYSDAGNQTVTFNAFKKPTELFNSDSGGYGFEYNPMKTRSFRFYKNQKEVTDKTSGTVKMYSSIIPAEITYFKKKEQSRIAIYIGGDAYTAPMVDISENQEGPHQGIHFLHRDYLGSVLAISNIDARVLSQIHFGAWGDILKENRNYLRGNGISPELQLVGRGFTGHEHYQNWGIIHMNGRLYDVHLRRFISPDNFVQDPYNTQSFNRYGYAWNNPLQYTDPSGEIVFTTALIIGLAVATIAGAYMGGVQANNGNWNPLKWDWGSTNTLIGVLGGGTIGGVSALVGIVAAPLIVPALASVGITGGILGTAAIGAFGGMVSGFMSGGFMSTLPGGSGNFWEDAIEGALWGAAIGGAIGALAGWIGTPKTHNKWTGVAPRPTVTTVSELTPQGIQGLDDGLTLRAEGIPDPQPAAVPQQTPTTNSQSIGKVQTNLEGKLDISFALQNVDDTVPGNYTPYWGIDEAGNVRYVGITSRDPAIRFAEHGRTIGTGKELLEYNVIEGVENLTKINARIFEQNLINKFQLGKNGGTLFNKINSISPKKWSLHGIE